MSNALLFRVGDTAAMPSGILLEVVDIHPITEQGQFLALRPMAGRRMEKEEYRWCPSYDFKRVGAACEAPAGE